MDQLPPPFTALAAQNQRCILLTPGMAMQRRRGGKYKKYNPPFRLQRAVDRTLHPT